MWTSRVSVGKYSADNEMHRKKIFPGKPPAVLLDEFFFRLGNVVDEEEPSSEEEHEDEDSSTDDEAQDLKKLGTLEKLRLRKQRMEFGLITPMAGDPYEKNLLRTATRGVIQLFNAVNKFQDEKVRFPRLFVVFFVRVTDRLCPHSITAPINIQLSVFLLCAEEEKEER